jgi:hypothetical protein
MLKSLYMNQHLPTPDQIKAKIANELHISHLSPDEQTTLIQEMSTILLDRITMAVISALPQDTMAQVDKLLEANQGTAVEALLRKHVPEAPSIASAVIAETLAEYNARISAASKK